LIANTGIFFDDCKKWDAKNERDQTWENFRKHFKKAHADIQRMREKGVTNAEGRFAAEMEEFKAYVLQCLDCNKTPEPEPVAAAATKDPNQVFMETMMEQMKEMKSQMEQLQKRNNNRNKGPPKQPTDYCWSHGYTFKNAKGEAHTSQNCNKPRDGHQRDATKENRMGGSENRKPKVN
jgi:hypothetical protein